MGWDECAVQWPVRPPGGVEGNGVGSVVQGRCDAADRSHRRRAAPPGDVQHAGAAVSQRLRYSAESAAASSAEPESWRLLRTIAIRPVRTNSTMPKGRISSMKAEIFFS